MKLLVLGGSGFVSGALARVALDSGHTVTVVTRGIRSLIPGVGHIRADRKQRDSFVRIIQENKAQWDMVVDCIGMEPEDARQDIVLFKNRTSQFVFLSTDFVFDPANRVFPQSDRGSYLRSGYGGNKRLCEEEFFREDASSFGWTIVRPCHIYGPGSLLGCLPLHARDTNLLATIRAGEPLRLVGGGHYLQQPIFVEDVARTILSIAGNRNSIGAVFNLAGPEIVESRRYYQVIAELLNVPLRIEEVPIADFLRKQPEAHPFCCHRFYDPSPLLKSGLHVPRVPLEEGLAAHISFLEGV